MDLHIVPGVKASGVAEAHRMDVQIEEEHHCKCMTYWVDESRGNIFCLIEAPTMEAVVEMHAKAHGLMPHRIIEVQSSVVESFLGRVSDPEETEVTGEGLKIFHDPSFRTLMMIRMPDQVLLQQQAGKEKTSALVNHYHTIIQQAIATCQGTLAEHKGSDIVASFTKAGKAIACAQSISQQMGGMKPPMAAWRIGISAGEPVTKNETLFGDAIRQAQRMCFIAQACRIYITSAVKELAGSDQLGVANDALTVLSPGDENFLDTLFSALEENWQDADFTLDDYCHTMAMSKSRLYRKTLALSGYSPNELLKEYRLEKAREIVKKKKHTISETCFETGFTSPSYFTKCFKKKYGMLPMTYLELQS